MDYRNINMNIPKIDVAVLGLGGMGETHVKAAKSSPYVNRIYGYEPNRMYCEKRAAELEIIPATETEIYTNPEIRLVYIASVNDAHVVQAIAALRYRTLPDKWPRFMCVWCVLLACGRTQYQNTALPCAKTACFCMRLFRLKT